MEDSDINVKNGGACKSGDSSRGTLIDLFYSREAIETWKTVLGPSLHYHFGFFLKDEDLETGQAGTVRNFYPYIPKRATVLDLGCGWSGPAMMLERELEARVLGVTASRAQAGYCRTRGLSVKVMNMEKRLPSGHFDVAFSLEALEHIQDKVGFLKRVRQCADRLVLSTGCIADPEKQPRTSFGETISFCTPAELKAMTLEAGWSIREMRNRRFESLRTLVLWQERFKNLEAYGELDGQLRILRSLVSNALGAPLPWAINHPLIDVVAD